MVITSPVTRPTNYLRTEAWDSDGLIWPPDQLIVEFWPMTCAYVANNWRSISQRNHLADIFEMQGVGGESLIKFARKFQDMCEKDGLDPKSKRLFWTMVRKRIDWDILRYIDRKLGLDVSLDALLDHYGDETPEDDWSNPMGARRRDVSMFHLQLADRVTQLNPEQQLALALYYYEGTFSQPDLANLLGISTSTLQRRIGYATDRLLEYARDLTVDYPPLRYPEKVNPLGKQTNQFMTWLDFTYGTADVAAYLKYINAHYRADVGYLVDFLDRANGVSRSPILSAGRLGLA